MEQAKKESRMNAIKTISTIFVGLLALSPYGAGIAESGTRGAAQRDLSTPTSRIVGHWVNEYGTMDLFIGPIDPATNEGTLVRIYPDKAVWKEILKRSFTEAGKQKSDVELDEMLNFYESAGMIGRKSPENYRIISFDSSGTNIALSSLHDSKNWCFIVEKDGATMKESSLLESELIMKKAGLASTSVQEGRSQNSLVQFKYVDAKTPPDKAENSAFVGDPRRDLSTPKSRIVGHWAYPGCDVYFGPIDPATKEGTLIKVYRDRAKQMEALKQVSISVGKPMSDDELNEEMNKRERLKMVGKHEPEKYRVRSFDPTGTDITLDRPSAEIMPKDWGEFGKFQWYSWCFIIEKDGAIMLNNFLLERELEAKRFGRTLTKSEMELYGRNTTRYAYIDAKTSPDKD